MIRVFTQPGCVQCTATYRKLNQLGLEFDVVDVSTDESALTFVRDLGYSQAPVVVAGDRHWSGYDPDKLAALA